MKTMYLLYYSQLIKTDVQKSLNEFLKQTNKKINDLLFILKNEGGLPYTQYTQEELEKAKQGFIYLYKTGQINEEKFLEKMNTALETKMSMETFKLCWNAMSTLSLEDLSPLQNLAMLQKEHKFILQIIAGSNPLHHQHITNQLAEHKIELELQFIHSYEMQTLDPEALKQKAIENNREFYRITDLTKHKSAIKAIEVSYMKANAVEPTFMMFSQNNLPKVSQGSSVHLRRNSTLNSIAEEQGSSHTQADKSLRL